MALHVPKKKAAKANEPTPKKRAIAYVGSQWYEIRNHSTEVPGAVRFDGDFAAEVSKAWAGMRNGIYIIPTGIYISKVFDQ